MIKITIKGKDLATISLWKRLGKPEDEQEIELIRLDEIIKLIDEMINEAEIVRMIADQESYKEIDARINILTELKEKLN